MSASHSGSGPALKPPPTAAQRGDGGSGRATSSAPAQDAASSSASVAKQKSHSSALCLIPDRKWWAQLQEVRCFKDKVPTCAVLQCWMP